MGLLELDGYNLTNEENLMVEGAKRFAQEVMRPAAIELDCLSPEDVIAKGSVYWDVIREFRRQGYHQTTLPKFLGGQELSGLGPILLAEIWGWGASDFAISTGACGLPFHFAALSPHPEMRELVEQYCADEEGTMIGCWAITEPDHGSDWLIDPNDDPDHPRVVPSVRAVLEGDHYVVSGQKAAWVSNGTIATHAALFVTIHPEQGLRGSGIAVVPLDLPGITRGKPLEKMGQRALNQGEIFFDEVRIPRSHMICEDAETYAAVSTMNLAAANAGMGSVFTGVAQSAFDEALQYSRVRIQGGKPIFEHQNIQLKLFNMFTMVEAARSLSRRVGLYNQTAQSPALHYSIASKTFCTDTAFKVASEAITIFGGVGLTKEYPIEKIFRDARASMIEDGVNETLALGGAQWLVA